MKNLDHEYEVKTMLTVGKLIDWLKQFPEDAFVYTMEPNTGTYQQIPDIEHLAGSTQDEKTRMLKYYQKWFNTDSKQTAKEKAEETVKDIFRYVEYDGVHFNP